MEREGFLKNICKVSRFLMKSSNADMKLMSSVSEKQTDTLQSELIRCD